MRCSINDAVSRRTIAVFLVLLSLASAPTAQATLIDQPATKHSTLIDKDGNNIADDTFADLMKGLLITGGQSGVRDAKFLFQQCFGGGMLDDLKTAFSNKVKWVGGAASRHDEPSWGTADSATDPIDGWTKALVPELAKNQTLLKAIDAAASNDPHKKRETGQSISANSGSTINLKDAAAKSHHAVLWAGKADGVRHFNDIKKVRDSLISQWGQPSDSVTVTVLFGDGKKDSNGNDLPADWKAQAATEANLKTAINSLKTKLDTDEQFLFYSSDHGGTETRLLTVPKKVAGGSNDIEDFDLSPGELDGMYRTPDNTPFLSISYSDLLASVAVYLNNVLLGDLVAGLDMVNFDVSESLLNPTNTVRIENASPFDFTLTGKSFYIGSINTSVPEPPVLLLLWGGIFAIRIATRQRG